jgi:F-type H+-transporting ATPase subunit delta
LSRAADAKVAKRYASALFAVANRMGKSDTVQRDLATLIGLWNQTPALQRMMESPLIPGERKDALVDQLFGKDYDELTRSFLHLLVDKRREEVLPAVYEEYLRLADVAAGLVRAEAVVAVPLEDAQRSALVQSLQERTGKRVELNVDVDPLILGGIVVRMQDNVIDGSVRGALERLREQMLHER